MENNFNQEVPDQNNVKKSSMFQYMSNPKAFTLRKWFHELLKIDYRPYESTIERVSASLITDNDLNEFGRLIGQVYETGYRKAVEDYRKQFEDMGLNVSITTAEEKSK